MNLSITQKLEATITAGSDADIKYSEMQLTINSPGQLAEANHALVGQVTYRHLQHIRRRH